jgi:hypothetical protein
VTGFPARVPFTAQAPSQYVTPVEPGVSSSWSATSGSTVTSSPIEATAIRQPAG